LSSDNPVVKSPQIRSPAPSEHYENFPVASWLCPPRLRPPIAAIYWFARTADDIADEGTQAPVQRLALLAQYRDDLVAIGKGLPHSGRWPHVFDPLARMLVAFRLPVTLLADLLSAFEQDVLFTAEGRRYKDDAELLDYCRRSANPVGRLLLHLYNVHDAESLARSDQVCSALQLINFWQDLGTDIPRARWYLTETRMQQHGVTDADLQADAPHARASAMVAACCEAARTMMLQGAALALHIPGRAGWELRLVVQGGLRILEKIAHLQHATWRARPRLTRADAPLLLWRAWRMPHHLAGARTP
jgi:squalene synthase HpnC